MGLQFAFYTEAAAAACSSFCSGALVRNSRGRAGGGGEAEGGQTSQQSVN
jgi:hypothetical protein